LYGTHFFPSDQDKKTQFIVNIKLHYNKNVSRTSLFVFTVFITTRNEKE
jgi:hypothetical protein